MWKGSAAYKMRQICDLLDMIGVGKYVNRLYFDLNAKGGGGQLSQPQPIRSVFLYGLYQWGIFLSLDCDSLPVDFLMYRENRAYPILPIVNRVDHNTDHDIVLHFYVKKRLND
jgi:hypothetical protein